MEKVKQFLVYEIISPNGISQPYITQSGLVINVDKYKRNCLAKILVPFIQNLPENTFDQTLQGLIIQKIRPIITVESAF